MKTCLPVVSFLTGRPQLHKVPDFVALGHGAQPRPEDYPRQNGLVPEKYTAGVVLEPPQLPGRQEVVEVRK